MVAKGKTEQRITAVVQVLRDAAPERLGYDEITSLTDTNYDILLYILQTLVEVGLVEREEEPREGPGRPKIFFRWVVEGRAQESGS